MLISFSCDDINIVNAVRQTWIDCVPDVSFVKTHQIKVEQDSRISHIRSSVRYPYRVVQSIVEQWRIYMQEYGLAWLYLDVDADFVWVDDRYAMFISPGKLYRIGIWREGMFAITTPAEARLLIGKEGGNEGGEGEGGEGEERNIVLPIFVGQETSIYATGRGVESLFSTTTTLNTAPFLHRFLLRTLHPDPAQRVLLCI
jgi:hypothetical protein